MNMTRRDFGKSTGIGLLGLAVGGSLLTEGCGNIFSEILAWVPVGKAAFQGIINLLEGAGLVNPAINALVTTILAGFDDLVADIKAYQAIQPPPAGALAKIQEVFSLIVNNFQSLLSQVAANPIATLIIGLAQIILSTIAGFMGQLPATAKTLQLTGTFRVGRETVSYTAKARTRRQFKKDWNHVAEAGGHKEIDLPLTFWESL
jgi:hypothetical protein